MFFEPENCNRQGSNKHIYTCLRNMESIWYKKSATSDLFFESSTNTSATLKCAPRTTTASKE